MMAKTGETNTFLGIQMKELRSSRTHIKVAGREPAQVDGRLVIFLVCGSDCGDLGTREAA